MDTEQIKLMFASGDRNFSGANLAWINLSNIDLRGADFYGANLSGANLSSTNLSENTNLAFANLSRADLSGADLRGADLQGANLESTILRDSIYDNRTRFPLGFNPQSAGAIPFDASAQSRSSHQDISHRHLGKDNEIVSDEPPNLDTNSGETLISNLASSTVSQNIYTVSQGVPTVNQNIPTVNQSIPTVSQNVFSEIAPQDSPSLSHKSSFSPTAVGIGIGLATGLMGVLIISNFPNQTQGNLTQPQLGAGQNTGEIGQSQSFEDREEVMARLRVEQQLRNWQPSCGSPAGSGTWWPVKGNEGVLEQAKSRFCGDAFVNANGEAQIASFTNQQEAELFAQELSRITGMKFWVGQPTYR